MPPSYQPVPYPLADAQEDNFHNNHPIGPPLGPAHTFPRTLPYIEYDPDMGRWRRGDKVLPRSHKGKYYLTRPHDGKRPGFIGRLKDAMTGQGGDVFVTISGDKRTLLRDCPSRWDWAGWEPTDEEFDAVLFDKDFREQDLMVARQFRHARERDARPRYNYRTRRYESERKVAGNLRRVWTNAQWKEGASGCDGLLGYRDLWNQWYSSVPWEARWWPGGRPYGDGY